MEKAPLLADGDVAGLALGQGGFGDGGAMAVFVGQKFAEEFVEGAVLEK